MAIEDLNTDPDAITSIGGQNVAEGGMTSQSVNNVCRELGAYIAELLAMINALPGASTAQTLSNKTLTSPVVNGTITGNAFLDEDDMASDSATKLASQQSIKAYVGTRVATAGIGYNPAGKWTDVLASRAVFTPIQNTTAFAIQVHLESGNSDDSNNIYVSHDNSTWEFLDNINGFHGLTFTVLPGQYYRVDSDNIADIGRWLELR